MKTKRKYIRVKDRRVGLKSKERTPSKVEKNGNQWTVTPKQLLFAKLFFEPASETFGNAYQSAKKAGYSHSHAKQITAESYNLQWVRDARRMLKDYKPEHIWMSYMDSYERASKWSDKLHALDSMARIAGMFVDRSVHQIDVQFTNGVPRPNQVIDIKKEERPVIEPENSSGEK